MWAGTAAAALGIALLCGFSASPAWAYEPTLGEIYTRILERSSVYAGAILSLENMVYDAQPGVIAEASQEQTDREPAVMPAWGFRQRVYWLRRGFLAIETFDMEGKPLHYYYDEGFGETSVNLDAVRQFETVDILHPFLPFLGESRSAWEKGATTWGILPQRVTINRTPKGNVLYGLQEAHGKAVWVDAVDYLPLRVESVALGGNHIAELRIEFGPYMIFGEQTDESRNLVFPRSVLFLLNGRLFKRSVLKDMDYDPNMREFPLTRLRQRAQALRSQSTAEASRP
ncbi:MAG: hypothetical protein HY342_08040 [Candidatus Lambdaproteobacteria bacterium]|nr:hypothetical protein [Candidatus Lambdaproteobacteria bacterium]